MSPKRRANLFANRLQHVVEELRLAGWTVTIEDRTLPSGLVADFVARRGDEMLIGEIASRDTVEHDALQQLARLAEGIPNARLQVYWLGDLAESPPLPDNVEQFAVEAVRIYPHSARGSFLLAWAALEAAITHFSLESILQESRAGFLPWQALGHLCSLGHVDEADFSRLTHLRRVRHEIAHQGSPIEPSNEDVSFLVDIAKRMATGQYVSVDDMVSWFLDGYEDPANQLPYDGAEGGYQYQGDGPYDADEVLREEFPHASEHSIREAARILNGISVDWIQKPNRH
ncbi:hypothetical protein [Verrucosispora sp. NA02020]|uniref:hypothetical protein n=1 Tax=Verrucosispora sp. NA02020 TaxID=2742132 RepID=UPI003D738C96